MLLFTVSLSHVGFAQDDGDLKPLFKSVTIENQTAAPLYVAVQQFTNFESQPSQTSLIVNQYAEALLPVKHQECIADADYGSCMDNENKSFLILFMFCEVAFLRHFLFIKTLVNNLST